MLIWLMLKNSKRSSSLPRLNPPCVDIPSSAEWTRLSPCHSHSSDSHRFQNTLEQSNSPVYHRSHRQSQWDRIQMRPTSPLIAPHQVLGEISGWVRVFSTCSTSRLHRHCFDEILETWTRGQRSPERVSGCCPPLCGSGAGFSSTRAAPVLETPGRSPVLWRSKQGFHSPEEELHDELALAQGATAAGLSSNSPVRSCSTN